MFCLLHGWSPCESVPSMTNLLSSRADPHRPGRPAAYGELVRQASSSRVGSDPLGQQPDGGWQQVTKRWHVGGCPLAPSQEWVPTRNCSSVLQEEPTVTSLVVPSTPLTPPPSPPSVIPSLTAHSLTTPWPVAQIASPSPPLPPPLLSSHPHLFPPTL